MVAGPGGALTFQELVGDADVGAQEVHGQLAELVEGAWGPVLPDAEGEVGRGEADVLDLEGVAGGEGRVHEAEVDAGTARPLTLSVPLRRGPQVHVEVDGELGEDPVCREKMGSPGEAEGAGLRAGQSLPVPRGPPWTRSWPPPAPDGLVSLSTGDAQRSPTDRPPGQQVP